MSTGVHGSHSSRSSRISSGGALAAAAPALTPAQKRSSSARSSGSSAAASRSAARRIPSVRISRSTGSVSAPANSESRPLHHPPVEVHLPEPVLRVDEALGEERSSALAGLDVGNAPAVAPHRRPRRAAPAPRAARSSCGSARRASRCQAIPTDAAAIPVPAAPASSPALATRLTFDPHHSSSSQNWPAGQSPALSTPEDLAGETSLSANELNRADRRPQRPSPDKTGSQRR